MVGRHLPCLSNSADFVVDEFTSKGVTIVFLQENLTYSPAGRSPTSDLMLNLLGAFAEFERSP